MKRFTAIALVALAAVVGFGSPAGATEPTVDDVTECGSTLLTFHNHTDEVVQFELRVTPTHAANGVYTLAADTTEDAALEFTEDSGAHQVEFRVLPDGPFTEVVTVESDCQSPPTTDPMVPPTTDTLPSVEPTPSVPDPTTPTPPPAVPRVAEPSFTG